MKVIVVLKWTASIWCSLCWKKQAGILWRHEPYSKYHNNNINVLAAIGLWRRCFTGGDMSLAAIRPWRQYDPVCDTSTWLCRRYASSGDTTMSAIRLWWRYDPNSITSMAVIRPWHRYAFDGDTSVAAICLWRRYSQAAIRLWWRYCHGGDTSMATKRLCRQYGYEGDTSLAAKLGPGIISCTLNCWIEADLLVIVGFEPLSHISIIT